jgi:hypothetical protein
MGPFGRDYRVQGNSDARNRQANQQRFRYGYLPSQHPV